MPLQRMSMFLVLSNYWKTGTDGQNNTRKEETKGGFGRQDICLYSSGIQEKQETADRM